MQNSSAPSPPWTCTWCTGRLSALQTIFSKKYSTGNNKYSRTSGTSEIDSISSRWAKRRGVEEGCRGVAFDEVFKLFSNGKQTKKVHFKLY